MVPRRPPPALNLRTDCGMCGAPPPRMTAGCYDTPPGVPGINEGTAALLCVL